MKKTIILILALSLLLTLAACGKAAESAGTGTEAPAAPVSEPASQPASESASEPAPSEEPKTEEPVLAGLANPMVSYESLEKLNEAVHGKLCTPAVMGVSDKAYFIYTPTNMAETQFTVNGIPYSFRFCADYDHDISGVYVDGKTAFEGVAPSDEIDYAEAADCKLAHWVTIDGQYVLCAKEGGKMEKDTFLGIAEELRSRTRPGMSVSERAAFYANLAGSYSDSVSQRATAEVTANGSEGVTVVVRWSSSAFETSQWVMEAAVSEDGLLSYPCESYSEITVDADGTEKQLVIDAEAVPGWFVISDGQLQWSGANREDCRSCVFEKNDAAQN